MSGLNNKKYLDGDGLIKFWEICCANFPAKDGRGATGTWPINITGNAATATNATTAAKLGTNAGSTTKPVYFGDGIPKQCSDTLDVSISGNASTSDEADKWSTARKITLKGGVTGNVDIDGSGDVEMTTTVVSSEHTHSQYYDKTTLQSPNTVYAGPSSGTSNAAASFRKLVSADIPDLSSIYLPKSGGTISSSSFGPLTIKRSGSSYAAAIKFQNDNGVLGSIGMGDDINGDLRIYSSDTTAYKTVLDSSNYNSYTPKLDGTGATGTWPISISGNAGGNAATATKLATSRTIWGQSFDGTGNISGNLTSNIWRIAVDSNYDATFIQSQNYDATSNNGTIIVSGWNGSSLQSFGVWAAKCYFNGNVGFGATNPLEKIEVDGNVKATKFIGALQGNADSATTMSSFTAASNDPTKRYVWMSWSDNSGKPAYSDKLTFQSSTNTLFSDKFVGNLTGNVTGNLTGNATSATTATNLANDPVLATSSTDTTQITVTAGEKTSAPFTVPYATKAGEAAKTAGTLTLKTPAETITFNGSEAKTFEVTPAKLGLTKAVLYLGKSTTAITDGGTEKPTIVIDGVNTEINTLSPGNIVIDSADAREYIWNGTNWEKFGLDGDGASGNYKPIQAVVDDPSVSTDISPTAFIDTISQDANGKITVTKRNVGKVANATLADSATKLQTSRYIWGQPFDGTGNIANVSLNLYKNPSDYNGGWARDINALDKDGTVLGTIGFNGGGNSLTRVYIGKSWDNPWVSVLPNGNVGIGTDDPSEKLTVNGNIRAAGNIISTGHLVTGLVHATSDMTNSFRTSFFGSNAYDERIKLFRDTSGKGSDFAASWSPGLAIGAGDVNGFISFQYDKGGIKVGGGNADKINWTGNVIGDWNIGSQSVNYATTAGSATTATTATNADALGGRALSNFITYYNDTTNGYVAASFNDSDKSTMAATKYIEFWDSPGWFNSHWGQVKAHNGFIGNLTGNAATATKATQDSDGNTINTTYLKRSQYGYYIDSYTFDNGPTDLGWVYLGSFAGGNTGLKIECDYASHCSNDYGTCASHLILGVRPYSLDGFISKIKGSGGGLYITEGPQGTNGYYNYNVYIYVKAWMQGQVRIQALGTNSFTWAKTNTAPDSAHTVRFDSRNLDGYYVCHKTDVTKTSLDGHTHSQIVGNSNSSSASNALLMTGAGRPDSSPDGDTWIFVDSAGSMSAPWGFKHEQADNLIGFYGAGSRNAYIDLSNGKMYGNNFITTSDRRMKENIEELQDCSKSLELGFYEFDYKTGGHSAGHIAQDVREVYPAFVHGEETEKDNLSVDYNGLHTMQIKALKDKVTTLENENNDLKNRVEKLEALIKKLM